MGLGRSTRSREVSRQNESFQGPISWTAHRRSFNMDWLSSYSSAISNFRRRLPSSKGLAVAFNTNIDGIIDLDSRRLRGFLSSEPDTADLAFERRDSPPGRIDSPVDFVAGLMHFVGRGAGGEYMIHDEETYEWIVSRLPIDQFRMGGNAGIMTNALAMLGAQSVIPHAVQLPEAQAKLFLDLKSILLPVMGDEGVEFASPATACRPDRELVHLILEYKEGTSFTWGGTEIISPRNNRYIVNADDYNGKIVIDPAFVEGVEKRLSEIDKFILTGLHMLKRRYPDGSTYKDRLQEALGHVAGWKSANPAMKVHFELADIQDGAIRGAVIDRACRVADSVGMNEDELQTILGVEGLLESGPTALVDGMRRLTESQGIGKLLLHSKDFVISLVMNSYGVNPGVVLDSQMLGVLSSQNRAYTGDFPTADDLEALLSSGALEISRPGADLYRKFEGDLGEPGTPGVWEIEGGWVVLAPCLLSKVTLNTVGLGDCLTAGMVLAEIS